MVVLSSILLWGCSQRQATPTQPAMERVQAGRLIKWDADHILHIGKRNGSSLEDVQLWALGADGHTAFACSPTATLSPGTVQDPADQRSVKITFRDVKTFDGSNVATCKELVVVLHE
jgi:hypothetical protein